MGFPLRKTLVLTAILAAGCGGCDEVLGDNNATSNVDNNVDNNGTYNEDNNFVAPDGSVCSDATPCGNCDQDCRPSGNPFAGGGGDGGDGSAGGGGTGYDGETCAINSDCRGLCGNANTCEGFGGGGYDGDSCLSDNDCRGTCGGDGLCTGGGTGGGGTGGGGGGGGGGTPNNMTPNNGTGGGGGTGGGDTTTCLDLQIDLEYAIPTVVLLIDQSGSMTEDFGMGFNRWEAAYASLMDPVDGLVQELQGAFRIGLSLYTNTGGPECPLLADVRPELNNYTPIDTVFAQAEPQNDTPTGESILGTLRQFDIHLDQGRKLLLLATDGEPDTCAVPNPQTGQPEAVAAAETAFQQGVETIALSVGDQVGAPHLQDMANAGVGLPVGGAQQAPYYTANDPDQLKNEMRAIIDSARSCIFRVQGGVIDPGLLDQSMLTVDGVAIQYNDPNGWIYHQNRATCQGAKQCIELQGDACLSIQDGQPHDIVGDFLCAYYDPENPPIGGGGGGGGNTNNGMGGGGGGGGGGPGPCVNAGGGCTFDGDCCSGICSANTGGICIVN